MPEKLAIVGASVRAAAFPALRAGFLPVCADRFADLDLRRRVPVVQVDDYPDGLAEAILREPVGGRSSPVVRAADRCASASARGRKPAARSSAWFFQKRVTGRSCSAVFAGDGNDAVLLGATWQLVGMPWTGAGEFGYAVSLGPIELSRDLRSQWERIGEVLARRFGLVGLFGVDAVLDNETLWPIEVNPRYTASLEVLERAFEIDAIRIHVDVCRGGRLPRRLGQAARAWCGKAILYARADLSVPPAWARFAEEAISARPWPELADVPAAGTRIRARSPVVTVLAKAAGEQAAHDLLRSRAAQVERRLYGSS